MRKDEAAALQWADIDLKDKTLNFQEDPRNPDRMFGDPKTFHSKRIITINQGLANDLHFHKKTALILVVPRLLLINTLTYTALSPTHALAF